MQNIWNFLKQYIGPALLVLIVLVLVRYGLPAVIKLVVALFGGTVGWAFNILAFIGLLVLLCIFLFDKGKLGSGACTLRTFWGKPDRCESVSCAAPCLSVKGPYPAWMGSWTFGTQDIACYCPPVASGSVSWPDNIQKLIDDATKYKDQSKLQKKIVDLLIEDGIEPGEIDKLYKILEKMTKGQELTSEEQEELKKIGKKP